MRQLNRWTGFFMLLMVALPLRADVGRDPYQFFFHETFGNYQDELAKARA